MSAHDGGRQASEGTFRARVSAMHTARRLWPLLTLGCAAVDLTPEGTERWFDEHTGGVSRLGRLACEHVMERRKDDQDHTVDVHVEHCGSFEHDHPETHAMLAAHNDNHELDAPFTVTEFCEEVDDLMMHELKSTSAFNAIIKRMGIESFCKSAFGENAPNTHGYFVPLKEYFVQRKRIRYNVRGFEYHERVKGDLDAKRARNDRQRFVDAKERFDKGVRQQKIGEHPPVHVVEKVDPVEGMEAARAEFARKHPKGVRPRTARDEQYPHGHRDSFAEDETAKDET